MGQQRITSLYGVIRGKPPDFFEGNNNAFMGSISTWTTRRSSSTSL